MATDIPHSLDSVIEALKAVIDGKPLPAEWQTADAPPPPAQALDEVSLMQGVSDLIDQRLAALPPPEAIAIPYPVESAVPDLTQPLTELGSYVVAIQQSQKVRDSRVDEITARIDAIEAILTGLAEAVHKDEAA